VVASENGLIDRTGPDCRDINIGAAGKHIVCRRAI
jgi:hypothetical protein